MSGRTAKPQPTLNSLTGEVRSDIQEFLLRELPRKDARRALYFADAVREAGERYDQYISRRDEWWSFAARRKKLKKIARFVDGVAAGLRELDVLSRDDLASRMGPKEIDELVGSLHRLSKEATVLIGQAQTFGRPRNLAEERWILALADIYENAFGQPATVWGKGGLRKGFYYFLELSRPKKFQAHGKLHPRQVDRLLKQRRVS